MLEKLVAKHTEDLVVEVEVALSEVGEKSPSMQLPAELVALLERPFGDGAIEDPTSEDITRVSKSLGAKCSERRRNG
jgi:hypothetical protein